MSIRSIETNLSADSLWAHVAELFPSSYLFAKESCDLPMVWVHLRNFLNERPAKITPHSSQRVIKTLEYGIYDDEEEREAPNEM